jgi:DNA-binding NtrC family response regulator
MNTQRELTQKILIVDDDIELLEYFSEYLQGAGLGLTATISDPREVMPYLEKNPVSVVILDNLMPHVSGMDLLPLIVEKYPNLPVILSTAVQEIEVVVACMKKGAFDYVMKSSDLTRLTATVRHALQIHELRDEYSALKSSLLDEKLERPEAFSGILTRDPRMLNIIRYIESVSASNKPILVSGESGTGKELIAQAIHSSSGRQGELVTVNISGTNDDFIADALFGHKREAFSGAESDKPGLIRMAEGGTLFLDEIGELSAQSQVKLLRLLEDKRYLPLGATRFESADVKIVAATNRPLKAEVDSGRFRKDLFYRLDTHHITLPPLRERKSDIPLLLEHFTKRAALSLKRNPPIIPAELHSLLANYDFPGNIRELESLVYDAVSQCRGTRLSLETFREKIFANAPAEPVGSDEEPGDFAMALKALVRLPHLRDAQRILIMEAMERANNNQGIAAELLGMGRTALNRRLKNIREGTPIDDE